jgi:DMSO/TMAO reductase YedYZ molybdopterin-dependent catalytic subunit
MIDKPCHQPTKNKKNQWSIMEINITGKNTPTSFDVVCSHCEWTGVATLDLPEKVTTISVGGEINFTSADEQPKCPQCNIGYIYGISGTYKRNTETNHMDRIGDYQH